MLNRNISQSENERDRTIESDIESSNISNEASDEGFKTTVWIQFDHIFYTFIQIGIYICVLGVIIDYIFAKNVDKSKYKIPDLLQGRLTKMLYTIDIFFTLDVILMILYWRSQNMDVLENVYYSRHPLILLVEIISLVPLEFVYYHMSEKEMTKFAALRLRYVLRITRFISIIKSKSINKTNVAVQLLLNILIILVITASISAYYYGELCKITSCDYAEWSKLYLLFIKLLNALMSLHLHMPFPYNEIYNEWYICMVWIGYFYSIYLRCYFTCICIEKISKQYDYIFRMKRDLDLLDVNELNDRLGKRTIMNFYNVQWKKGLCADIYSSRCYLPEIIIKEIKLDMRWNGLKHTHLFRKQSVHFLRHLSMFIKVKYLHGGEVIYRRGHTKSFLIYIMMGSVHMLGGNGETPMISFGRGTVFGETSLYIPTIASNTVICQGYSQIGFLHREDYIKIRFKYPQVYNTLQKYIARRLSKVRLYYDIVRRHNERVGIAEQKASLSIKYVKSTLSALLGVVDMKTQLNQTWSLSHKRFEELQLRTAFCAKYLDMYVLTSDTEIATELNLAMELTATLPPDSMLIIIFEKIIVAFCIIYYVIIMAYVCFSLDGQTDFFYVLVYFLTLLWIFDLFLQCSVHVVSKDVVRTKRFDIFLDCLSRKTFYIDLIAALPGEIIFSTLDGDLKPHTKKLFYLNRLFKIYRVFQYFRLLENDAIPKLMLKENLKYFFYFIALVYGIVCIQAYYYSTPLTDLNVRYFILQISTSISLITGVSFNKIKLETSISWLGIIFQLIIFIFYTYVFAMIAAGTSMYMKSYQRYYESEYNTILSTNMLNKKMQLRVKRYLQLHSMTSEGLYLLDQLTCFKFMTDNMKLFSKQNLYNRYLTKVAFLKDLPPSLLVKLYSICSFVLMPANEVLYYANEAATDIYIITHGFCQSNNGRRGIKRYQSGDSLNVMSCFMETTSIDTVGTVTAVACIVLAYDRLKTLMNRHDPNIIKQMRNCIGEVLSLDKAREETVAYVHQSVEKELSIITNKQNKYYYKGFPSHLRFLKSFLLLITFTPYGAFAMYWEMTRTILSLVNIFLSSIPTTFSYQLSVEVVLLIICDLFAIVDLYIQHHICYFNDMSLLVYHPFFTARHYIRHGFSLDLISVLPFDWIYLLATKKNASILTASIMRSNRFLQFIRVYKFSNYILGRYAYYNKCILIVRWLVLVIYMIQIFSFLMITETCTFNWQIDKYHVECSNKSIIYKTIKSNQRTFYPYFTFYIQFHIIAFIFCLQNIAEVALVDTVRVLIVELMSLSGLIMYIAILVMFIANGIFSHSGLISHQTKMKNLVHFMYGRVAKNVQKEIIDYFEYIWQKTSGHNLKESVQIFNSSLRMDSLYNVYGKVLKYSGIFPKASKPFIKSFMMHISHEYYQNRGIICKVNDIHGMIYIVFKGTVAILGPDYNRLLTLVPGSIFGNLDNVPLVRQTLTMVANGHVEVLSIPSVTFYSILSKYPLYLKEFKRHTMVHVDYIETFRCDDMLQNYVSGSMISRASRQSKQENHNYLTQIRHRNKFIKIWDSIIINFAYFLSVNIESFCTITLTQNVFLKVFLYIFDLMAVFNMYLKFHTVIRDEFGFIVLDRAKISKTYRKALFGFYVELVATLPLELLTLFFINHKYYYFFFYLTRSNRLLRFPMIFNVTLRAKQKLNVNVYVIRILSSLLWLNATFCISSILMALVILPAHGINCDHSSFAAEWHFFIQATFNVVKITNGIRLDFKLLHGIKWYTLLTASTLILLQKFVIDVLFVSQICATMQILRSFHTKYQKYVAWLDKFLIDESISLPLYMRILEYAKLLWLYQSGVQFPSLLNEAPYYIREAVLDSVFGFHLRDNNIFKDCHVDFLRQVAASIKCTYHFYGDVICYVGDIDECMYIIHKGKVAALIEDSLHQERTYCILRSGEIFGIKQVLLKKTGHDYTYKALEYTVILTIRSSEFNHLLKFFPASRFVIYKALEESIEEH